MADTTPAKTYTFEQLKACLCVWEDILLRLDAAADSPNKIADLTAAQENFGYASLRLTAAPAIADRRSPIGRLRSTT